MRAKAAPLAALIAVLALALPYDAHPSVGFPVRLAGTRPCGNDDRRIFFVQVLRSGSIKLNNEDVRLEDLGRHLEEAFRTRVYRYIFVAGEPGLLFGDVAEVIDYAAPHVDHVVLVTPSVMKQADWRAGVCIDENLPRDYISNPPR